MGPNKWANLNVKQDNFNEIIEKFSFLYYFGKLNNYIPNIFSGRSFEYLLIFCESYFMIIICRILVSSDIHLGFGEKLPIRGDDSFVAFDELLGIGREQGVDVCILGNKSDKTSNFFLSWLGVLWLNWIEWAFTWKSGGYGSLRVF